MNSPSKLYFLKEQGREGRGRERGGGRGKGRGGEERKGRGEI